MRVIAGELKGRVFQSPSGHRTHPMSDKARGALFNTLGDISGLTVLDAFAGSGALCFEAVSRGAKLATASEVDNKAQKTIEDNIKNLGLINKVKLIKANARVFLRENSTYFDIVILDPPFDNLQQELLNSLSHKVKTNGILVVSCPGSAPTPSFNNFSLLRSNDYNDNKLLFYRRQ